MNVVTIEQNDAAAQSYVEGENHSPRQGLFPSRFAPRRFEPRFSLDFYNLQYFCQNHGFEMKQVRRWYRLRKIGAKGNPKLLTLKQLHAEIDRQIRIPLGLEPILRRAA